LGGEEGTPEKTSFGAKSGVTKKKKKGPNYSPWF